MIFVKSDLDYPKIQIPIVDAMIIDLRYLRYKTGFQLALGVPSWR